MPVILLLFFVLGFVPEGAQSLPLPRQTPMSFPESFTSNYDFEGIVKLNNCSGSLIQLEGAPDTNNALILTNGHCLESGMPAPGKHVYGQKSTRSFGLLDSEGRKVAQLVAIQIVYATMTKTDMTIYKLAESYADIKSKYGVRPLMLASSHPAKSEPIEVISGYWLKGYSCSVEGFVNQLKEAGWTWEDSLRYSRPGCETIGGTSGSPIVATKSRQVIGVNNTGNESGGKCTMNNPCEVDKDGNVTYEEGVSYGQETYWVYSCLDKNFEINLSVEGCLLPH